MGCSGSYFRNGFRMRHSLVRQWIHACVSLRGFLEVFHTFFVKRWFTDPEVDSRLSGVSASHLFCASREEYMIWIFLLVFLWEMTSGLSPYSVLSLVRQRIHALRQSI